MAFSTSLSENKEQDIGENARSFNLGYPQEKIYLSLDRHLICDNIKSKD